MPTQRLPPSIAVVVLLSNACGGTPPPADAVIAEESAAVEGVPDRGLDPSVVALSNARGQLCSGVLLASDVVLTARQCVLAGPPPLACEGAAAGASASPSSIRVYTTLPTAGAPWVAVGSAVLTPADEALCGDDLALVVLSSPVAGRTPTVASGAGEAKGAHVRTVAYGLSPGGQPSPTPILREHVAVVDVSASELAVVEAPCVGAPGGVALDESSGEVVGVLSRWGALCGAPGGYDVYTRVDAFRSLVVDALAWSPALAGRGADAGVSDAGRKRDAGRPKKPTTDVGAACSLPGDCGAGVCVSSQGSQYCSRSCAADDRCPTGYKCVIAAGGGLVCARP